MAKHKRQDQTETKEEGIGTLAQQTIDEQRAANNTSDADRERETNLEVADQDAARLAAEAYAESEIDRSNRVAREQDERTLDKDGKPKETKAERFKRLAQKRVTKALAVLGHVHNLTNANSYSYTPEQAQKIVDALVLAVNKIVDGFSGSKNGKVTFTL